MEAANIFENKRVLISPLAQQTVEGEVGHICLIEHFVFQAGLVTGMRKISKESTQKRGFVIFGVNGIRLRRQQGISLHSLVTCEKAIVIS